MAVDEELKVGEKGGVFGEGGVAVEVVAEVVGEGGDGGVAVGGGFREAFHGDGGEGVVGLWRGDGALDGVVENGLYGVAGVGRGEGEEVVEEGGEHVDVGVEVDLLKGAVGLFGGHVAGGAADDGAGGGVGEMGGGVGGGDEGGESPVEEVQVAKVADHDVGGFDVEVEDAFGVGVFDGVADVEEDLEEAGEGVGVPGGGVALLKTVEDGFEGFAAEAFHGEVGVAGFVEGDVVDGENVGVLEVGGEAGFVKKGLDVVLRGDAVGLDEGHGEGAAGAGVFYFPDGFHAAVVYFLEGLVAGVGLGVGEFGGVGGVGGIEVVLKEDLFGVGEVYFVGKEVGIENFAGGMGGIIFGWLGCFHGFLWWRYSGKRGMKAKKNPAFAGVFRSRERVVGCGLRSNSC